MKTYSSNNFHSGLKIILNNEPCIIESSEFVKPGKGQSFVRVKLRRLLTGTRIDKTFKSTDSFKGADILDIQLTYIYRDSNFWYFINKKTFEQLSANAKVIKDNVKWLLYQKEYIITLWNNQPILITPPNFIDIEIVNTGPSLRGDTISSGSKLATLSTGAVIKVPLFIQVGDLIKVNTRSGEYISRIK